LSEAWVSPGWKAVGLDLGFGVLAGLGHHRF
jgi:hypothetical protein